MLTNKYEQYRKYANYVKKYRQESNAATASEVDANANVDNKNIATCDSEIAKREKIGYNRLMMIDKITEMWGADVAEEYIRQIESHEIYKHDETSIYPYTYSAKETIIVKINEEILLVSFEDLYELCDAPEYLADPEKNVWCKYPEKGAMLILDKNGWTNVSRLVKKQRHRNLVRVKTAFGEDLIVTDNHPLIVEDNVEKTVDADKSKGLSQYRVNVGSYVSFGDTEELNMAKLSPYNIYQYDTFYDSQTDTGCVHSYVKSLFSMNREMGYFIGFFIGDGNYIKNEKGFTDTIAITQKQPDVLKKIAQIIWDNTGIGSRIIFVPDKQNCWRLLIKSADIVFMLSEVLGIKHYAQNKTLPKNIFSFSKEFATGIIEGLIDSDGTVGENGMCSVRLASRTAILQLSTICHVLGISGGNIVQNLPFSNNSSYNTNYTIFGYQFRLTKNTQEMLSCSTKVSKCDIVSNNSSKYSTETWATITDVKEIEEGTFLDENGYIYDITTDTHSFVCNGLWAHNCVSITMYPFLFYGLKSLGGKSGAPKHLDSFCGEFINLVFAIAAQFAGAVSTPEFLMYMDYFIRKDYGNDYTAHWNEIISPAIATEQKTLGQLVEDKFQQVVHSINQPAAARGYQAVFWNIAYFDEPYFKGMFDNFVFPDSSEPNWETVSFLQKRFMKWFNKERLSYELTFPVETLNLLNDGKEYVDKEWADFGAEMYSEGHSFFTYTSDSVDSLASCCRLKNEVQDNTFSYTLGAGGVSTGSKGVMTININRLVQNAKRDGIDISEAVREQVKKIHKYLLAFNEIVKDNFKANLLTAYNAGYISLDKQYLTIGINGFVEGAEFLGIDISPNEQYFAYGESILKPIYEENRKARTSEVMFNTEFVPGENLGIKNAKWDKKDGYIVPRNCYNSYFYKVEDESCNLVDKFILHGKRLTKYLDGGSALHANLEEHLSKPQYKKVMEIAINTGCSYFTFNIPNTVCNDCGFITKHNLPKCPKCGSDNVDYLTRIIGYLKRVSKWSEARQKEAKTRYYDNNVNV